MSNLYDYNTVTEVHEAMETLRKDDPEMFIHYTLGELIDDAVTAGLLSPQTGIAYLESLKPKV